MKKNGPKIREILPVAMLVIAPIQTISAGADLNGQKDDWSSLKTGKEIYFASCVACHGARGQGADPSLLGFDPGPPDFTDCKFTSREMSNDWAGIVSGGGPMKGFSTMMPAFGKALSRDQIEKVVAFIKDFCPEKKWPPDRSPATTMMKTPCASSLITKSFPILHRFKYTNPSWPRPTAGSRRVF